jgi:hypothetical protein
MRKFLYSVLAGSGLALSVAPRAHAHIELIEPLARYAIQGSDTGIKSCPCGLGGSNRVCNVAQDGSDPDRSSDRVVRYEAGSTITLRFNEFINHSGRFRVAFDPDGADVADFNANILNDIPDPNNANDTEWEIEVTLPSETCDNCTLQLVQAMDGNMVDPVLDPSNISSYYSCVDIELVAPGTLGTDTPAPPDAPTTPEMPGGEQPAGDDGAEGASDQAGNSMDTPLIPTAPPTSDSAATTGSPAPATPATGGMVAMNDMLGGAQTPSLPGMGSSAPSSLDGTANSSSSGGGCSLGSSGTGASSSAFGLAAFGLTLALGLRQRSRKNSR